MTADAEDFVLARFWTRAGMPVIIQADLVSPAFTQFLEVHGDNGTLMVSIQPEMPQFVFTREAAGGYAAGRTDLGRGRVNLFEAQMADFVAAVRDRGEHAGATLAGFGAGHGSDRAARAPAAALTGAGTAEADISAPIAAT